jgi:hypothetical protein
VIYSLRGGAFEMGHLLENSTYERSIAHDEQLAARDIQAAFTLPHAADLMLHRQLGVCLHSQLQE